MEGAQRRRIDVLCSHFRPNSTIFHSRNSQFVSTSNCSEFGSGNQFNFQNDCVFCQIILGHSPAFKILGWGFIYDSEFDRESVTVSRLGTKLFLCVFRMIFLITIAPIVLYEDDVCISILDTNPLSRGHCLLIPKLHCRSIDTTPPSVIAAMCSKIPFISSAVKKATDCDSFNLLVNNGAASGQVIFHTHIHIIPRKPRDRLWNSESLRRLSLELDEEASQLAQSIRAQLSHESNLGDCKDQCSNLADSQSVQSHGSSFEDNQYGGSISGGNCKE